MISVALSALQHYLFCPRQCALIHVERLWAENFSTAEGNVLHEKAHSGKGESRPGVKISRSLNVWSDKYALTGICDIVEIHSDGSIFPVEYKRGRPKKHRADEIQLCAQAICLEENFKLSEGTIELAYIFYGKQQRRTPIPLNSELRELTLKIANEVREMILNKQTPEAEFEVKKCKACSLIHLCQPQSMRLKRGVSTWFKTAIENSLQ